MKIPTLYETENLPISEKIIYQKYEIKEIDFFWLIAEIDEERGLAFGYANLNDSENAEWGYISIQELKENGVIAVKNWIPKKFHECFKAVKCRGLF